MPCHSAMIAKPPTATLEKTVDQVLKVMKKQNVDYVPVIDDKGILQGVFSYNILFKNLLPVSVPVGEGLTLDVTVGAAPGIAKRLKKIGPVAIAECMSRKVSTVHPQTPTWEGISILLSHGEPLLVVEPGTGKLVGVVTHNSALEELQRLKDSEK